jgi:hypothetical protein
MKTCPKCKLSLTDTDFTCGSCGTFAPSSSPGIITALQVIGGIAVCLAGIALAYTAIAAASTVDKTPLLDWMAPVGTLIFGLLLIALAAIIDKLHRVELLLARAESKRQ